LRIIYAVARRDAVFEAVGLDGNIAVFHLASMVSGECELRFDDALQVDYDKLYYDFVFTSPPYYFIQKYENNPVYSSKQEMDNLFYIPIFNKVYTSLQPNGYFIINICKEVYDNVLIKLFGEAHEVYPYKKSKRQNDYNEIIYVWKK
jgi:DNA modification methylase